MKLAVSVSVLLLLVALSSHAGQCSYSLSPASASAGAAAGSGSVTMTAGTTCAWTAATTNAWLHTSSAGTGNGTISYTVDSNASIVSRTGAISAGGKTFVLTQAGAPVSLGVAVDNTNLVWETAADYPFRGTNPPAPTFDGRFSAVSGNQFVPSSSSWLQTTVVGPGTLSFWWRVDSDATLPYSFDALEFDLNGQMQDQIMGQVDWNYRSYSIPPGTNVLTWQYVKDATFNAGSDQGWLDQIQYTTNTPISLAQALDTCGVTWTTGGNTNPTYWAGQTSVTHDGQSAAQSGALYLGQQSTLQSTVSGVTNLSFWWKVSSQTNYDYLEFYTNSVLATRISGEVDWRSNFFRLPASTNQLKWRFVRTNLVLVAQGQEAAWIDQVTVTPAPGPQVLGYATNVLLSTTVSNCHAVLPDLTGPNYLSLGDNCSSTSVTQSPPAGTLLSPGASQATISITVSTNTTKLTNNIFVIDQAPPLVAVLGANPLTNECHAAFADPGATTTDNCSGVVNLTTNNSVNPNAPGTYVIEYVATDSSGNAATNSRTVYIVDTQPPVVTLNGPNPLVIECHAGFSDPGASASDDCAGSVAVSVSGSVDPNTPGSYQLVYSAVDPSGNSASKSRTVQVVDTTPPQITQAVAPQTLAAGSNCTAVLPDLTPLLGAVDNCSPVLNRRQVPVPGTVLPLGSTNVVLYVDDGNGNTNSSVAVVMVTDQTLPVITTQPACQTNCVGAQVTFTVAATSCSALSYQWFSGTTALAGQTNSTLVLPSVRTADAGTYYAEVTSSAGSAPSVTVQLVVTNVLLVPPTMLSSQLVEGGAFQFSFSGPVGQTYRVLATSEVDSPMTNWQVLTNGTFTADPVVVSESTSDYPRRFYRLASP